MKSLVMLKECVTSILLLCVIYILIKKIAKLLILFRYHWINDIYCILNQSNTVTVHL